jgi:glycerol-3-phosphate dehydrogenase
MQDKDLMAQVLFAIQFEGARTLDDIVRRRIGYGTYGIPKKNDLEKIAHFASKYLKWTPQKIKQEVENTLNNYPIKLLKH